MAHPFRHATIHCPRCRTAALSDRALRHCSTCEGVWIPNETLAEHVGNMQLDTNPNMVWSVETTRLGLPCALCRHPMEALTLFGVPVDRCHSHGAWFDEGQLAETLHRSTAHVRPVAKETSEGAVMLVDAGAEVALVAASEVGAEASVGILGGVLDVIGGIFSAIDL